MIRADNVTYAYTVIGVLIAVYLSTFELGLLILFPVILLTTGIALQVYLMRKVKADEHIDATEGSQIIFYTIIALAVISVTSFFASAIPRSVQGMSLTGSDQVMFMVLMAIAEEQFFRGAITQFFLSMTAPMLAIIGSAAIFAVYHLAVYGTDVSVLLYVFVAGTVLAWISYRTRRLSPATTAHVINNILASVM